MSANNNTVYILSASFNSRGKSLMYVRSKQFNKRNGLIATLKLSQAMVFETEDQANKHRYTMHDTGWQVQPISPKIIFEAKLKGI